MSNIIVPIDQAKQAITKATLESALSGVALASDVDAARVELQSQITASQSAIFDQIADDRVALESQIETAAAGNVVAPTWAELSAIAGTRAGQPGAVPASDVGTHADPVVGGTVKNAGAYTWSTSPAGWRRIGDPPVTVADLSTAFASLTGVVDARVAGGDLLAINRPGLVMALVDRTGRVALQINDDGSCIAAGRRVVTEEIGLAGPVLAQRMYLGAYGDGMSRNIADGSDPLTYGHRPARLLQINDAGSGTAGWTDSLTYERATLPVARAMLYGPLAGTQLIVDHPGLTGTTARIDQLTGGTAAFNALVGRVTAAASEAATDGMSFGIAAMLWQGGTEDGYAAWTADAYLSAFRAYDAGERAAFAPLTGGVAYPRFCRQIGSHALLVGDALQVALAQGMVSAIPNCMVTGPGYLYQHGDGAALGDWSKARFLTPDGHRHAGMMDAKAWRRWALTGSWRPCELTSARRVGSRLIDVFVHVPSPPLQFSTQTVAQVADGHHGLEVWIGATRYAIASVSISDDGATTGQGRITVVAASDLPAGPVEVWAARTSDTAGTVAGNYREGCQPGPLTGPRTTICDSDDVYDDDDAQWAYRLLREPPSSSVLGERFDMRNYLMIGKVIAQ